MSSQGYGRNTGNDAIRSISELQPEADGAVLFNLYMYEKHKCSHEKPSLLCVLLNWELCSRLVSFTYNLIKVNTDGCA